jgi:hypothetical protein
VKPMITVKYVALFLLCVALIKAVSDVHLRQPDGRDESAPN